MAAGSGVLRIGDGGAGVGIGGASTVGGADCFSTSGSGVEVITSGVGGGVMGAVGISMTESGFVSFSAMSFRA